MPGLKVRPEAELDALDAALWYDGEREGLGTQFLVELRTTFERIEQGPQQYPRVFHECRRAILHRFPFGVFFIVEDDAETVVAIMHLHRDRDAWQARLK